MPIRIYLITVILVLTFFTSFFCFVFAFHYKKIHPYCLPSVLFLFLPLLFSSDLEDIQLIFILQVTSPFLPLSRFIQSELEGNTIYSITQRRLLRNFLVACTAGATCGTGAQIPVPMGSLFREGEETNEQSREGSRTMHPMHRTTMEVGQEVLLASLDQGRPLNCSVITEYHGLGDPSEEMSAKSRCRQGQFPLRLLPWAC